MAASKTRTSLAAAQTLTAGGANFTSTKIDLSAAYGAQVDFKITNGTTAPTVPAQVQVWVANNYNAGSPTLLTQFGGNLQGSAVASAVAYFSVEIPIGVECVWLVGIPSTTASANTTLDADISVVTAL